MKTCSSILAGHVVTFPATLLGVTVLPPVKYHPAPTYLCATYQSIRRTTSQAYVPISLGVTPGDLLPAFRRPTGAASTTSHHQAISVTGKHGVAA